MNYPRLRQSQEEILRYTRGKMGISAVPGSGKTWTLSLLAAKIIINGELDENQEVLIVTLVNSAVDNFNKRIADFIRQNNLIPNLGYRVRTLHGLAHDIVRERPGLVGLADTFVIVDEREADSIRSEIAQLWLKEHPEFVDQYISPELDMSRREKTIRLDFPNLVRDIALSFIRFAKDQQLTPVQLRNRLDGWPLMPLAEMGWEMYRDYQRALNYRGAVDFDDLVRLAVMALDADHSYLDRLRGRWPYILEDEAQDSSRLQEIILRKLAGVSGNWVRVGDPNQAIYETFTTANPRYLRQFLQEDGVSMRELPESGRSTRSIVSLANRLIEWTKNHHPILDVRDALDEPFIQSSGANDPQPSPTDDPTQIFLILQKFTPQQELDAVVKSIERWLPGHQESTIAVLVPRNTRGYELANALINRGIEINDSLLQSSSSTRFSVGMLGDLLGYLADPQSARKLARVFEVWQRINLRDNKEKSFYKSLAELIRKIQHVEDFLWPGLGSDWLAELSSTGISTAGIELLQEFRDIVRRWQSSAILPIDQIIITIAQDLLTEPDELAVSHKLALMLKERSRVNPEWNLGYVTNELNIIARNERRFLGFSSDDVGFNPDNYPGKVVISTYHKAKGLEWDRVYLISVNNYDFPSGIVGDQYTSEKWYLRGSLNLEAEALAQLKTLFTRSEYTDYVEGEATLDARLEYIRERLRLLFVGITRAKKELIITSNTGRKYNLVPAVPLVELVNFWEKQYPGSVYTSSNT